MQYEARSVLPTPPLASGCERPAQIIQPPPRNTYLQLPALDPRIPELAKQITAHADNPYDKARAVESYLRSHYGYTLDLSGPPQADPLAYFLFEKRAGALRIFRRGHGCNASFVGHPRAVCQRILDRRI